METRCEEIIASKRERLKILSNISSPVEKIYYRGNPDLLEGPCVAVVGTRGCTAYGIRVAGQLSERLAESGIAVISGLAKGIDTVAHRRGRKHRRGDGWRSRHMLSRLQQKA